MNKRERLQRPEADRTAPNRTWGNAFKAGDSASPEQTQASDQASANATNDSASAGVARGVELGYKVMAEQLATGQRLGQQFMPGLIETWSGENLFNEQNIGQFLQIYGQFASMFMQAAGSAVQAPANSTPSASKKTTKKHLSERDITRFDLDGAGSISIELSLSMIGEAQKLKVHPLFALDSDASPITDVSLVFGEGTNLSLYLRLPSAATVGRFCGAVCDAETNASLGTLTIIKQS